MPVRRHIAGLAAAAVLLAMQGCFTGVESTPKITYSEVKRQKADAISPEQVFLADVAPEPPAKWKAGKRFYLSDPKAALVLNTRAAIDSLVGSDIELRSIRPATSITGEVVAEIEFADAEGHALVYRDNVLYADLDSRQMLEVPFLIEESVVDSVRCRLVGNEYYAVTPLWYSADGTKAVDGLRHVAVRITAVEPGNCAYPVRVLFEHDGEPYSMYMTVGAMPSSTRNFHTLFAFDDPRAKHPRISDEDWALITHSQVRAGMTREECRLALGQPSVVGQRPTTAGMVEYWSYTDGVYLLFEEGLLTEYRK